AGESPLDPSTPRPAPLSRRGFLSRVTAGSVAIPLLGGAAAGCAPAASPSRASAPASTRPSNLNILFVLTDQERHFRRWPAGFDLPARERLQRTGVTFHRHYCPATMCTSSRSVLLTGLQTCDTGMFENTDLPWIKNLSPSIPTVGHMLRKAGYYTAYKGKWHLTREFDREPDRLLDKEMEVYGFSDYRSLGDVVGHQLGGYYFDHLIAGSASTWLRHKGRPLSDEGRPWALFVSLVNPHDVMYLNTDATGERRQDTGRLLKHAVRPPRDAFYDKTWDVALPRSFSQPLDAPGRPRAHTEYQIAWDEFLGHVPLEPERWRRLNDFYLNSLRAVDLQMLALFQDLDRLGLSERTIIVLTSDHGEMAGAHGGMRGKGPFPYEECIHVPLHVVHPDVRGGQDCRALTGHIDVTPTLLAMAGVAPGRSGELAGRELPGRDLTAVLGRPGTARADAVREGILFTYSGLVLVDSEPVRLAAKAKAEGKDLQAVLKTGVRPDFRKRGTVRTVFDGRYKFTRYFSPLDRHRPETLDQLYQHNDVELFDLQADPDEVVNLAAAKGERSALALAMSAKLEALIQREMGTDDGREMPDGKGVTWTLDVQGDEAILD
ncbi:MAG TPA: sulfatase-like hydrolase/transferase, partial [Vicinamibacteria bacterium]|nr:sulfatase-like hydrolase/transferase [Vicinamibacteria bacterium]